MVTAPGICSVVIQMKCDVFPKHLWPAVMVQLLRRENQAGTCTQQSCSTRVEGRMFAGVGSKQTTTSALHVQTRSPQPPPGSGAELGPEWTRSFSGPHCCCGAAAVKPDWVEGALELQDMSPVFGPIRIPVWSSGLRGLGERQQLHAQTPSTHTTCVRRAPASVQQHEKRPASTPAAGAGGGVGVLSSISGPNCLRVVECAAAGGGAAVPLRRLASSGSIKFSC